MFKIDDLKEVFELAANAGTFINELMKIKINSKEANKDNAYAQLASSGYSAQLASSGYSAKLASSGDYAQLASSGDSAKLASSGDSAKLASSGYSAQLASSGYYAKLASSGYSAQLASSGDSAQLASSGYSAQLASSGYYAKLASSGDYAKLASSGDYAQLASSGYSAQLASSGDYAQLASSGDSAQLASSGDYAKLASSGDSAVIAAIGFWSVASAKKGSWITLCEYRINKDKKYYPYFVKTEYVDGAKIKENTLYGIYNKEFREIIEVDGIQSLLISKKNNLQKVVLNEDFVPSYIFTKDGVSAHGRTVKQAYRDWLYKTSPRDMSEYECLKLNDIRDLNFWAVCYRTITGACSYGTENYLDNNKDKYKDKMTLAEVFTATEGQYGHNTFVDFFKAAV